MKNNSCNDESSRFVSGGPLLPGLPLRARLLLGPYPTINLCWYPQHSIQIKASHACHSPLPQDAVFLYIFS